MDATAFARSFAALMVVICAAEAGGSIAPGMALEKVADTAGYVTSLAFDSSDRLWYSTRDGGIYRLDDDGSREIARVETANEGNAALLGIAFRADDTIVAHYVTPTISADVLAEIEPGTGAIRELARFPCTHWPVCSSEHHGGNPIVATDGSVFVGIGDFNLPFIYAQDPDLPAGKVHQVFPDGRTIMFARGFRNPFDLALDPVSGALLVPDNGPTGEDEINLVRQGDNAGWPMTVGAERPVSGMLPPAYVFPGTVAPTGVFMVTRLGRYASGGALIAAYVSQTLYYIPDLNILPLPDPRAIIEIDEPMLDVTQTRSGAIFIATPTAIHRLVLPDRGDVNGDGVITLADLDALDRELVEGAGERAIDAPGGASHASWGADANGDEIVDRNDRTALVRMLSGRRRSVRH